MDKNEITRIEMQLWIDAYHGAVSAGKYGNPESVADTAVSRFRQRFDLDAKAGEAKGTPVIDLEEHSHSIENGVYLFKSADSKMRCIGYVEDYNVFKFGSLDCRNLANLIEDGYKFITKIEVEEW